MHELKFASTTNIRAKYSPHTGHTRQRWQPFSCQICTCPVNFGKSIMVNPALFFWTEPKSSILATSCAADELIAVRWTSITTFVRTIAGFVWRVVVFEQSCLWQWHFFSLNHDPDSAPPLSSGLLSRVLLKGSRCQLIWNFKLQN